jgi:hypothetical protein
MALAEDEDWKKWKDVSKTRSQKSTYSHEMDKCVLLCIKHHDDITAKARLIQGARESGHTPEELAQMKAIYPAGNEDMMEDVGYYNAAITPEALINSYRGRPNWEQLKQDPKWLAQIEKRTAEFGVTFDPQTEGFNQLPEEDRRFIFKEAMARGVPNSDQTALIDRGSDSIQSNLAFAQEVDKNYQESAKELEINDPEELARLKQQRDEIISTQIKAARSIAEFSKENSIGLQSR